MVFIGKGVISAKTLKSLHCIKEIKEAYFNPNQRDSLNKGWSEDKPAKIYLKRGVPPEVLDGRHRSAYFVLIGKPDYMVPVEFYTDD